MATMAEVDDVAMDGSLYNVELAQSQDAEFEYRRYRDLPHRSFNDTLKSHSSFAVKLSETGEYSTVQRREGFNVALEHIHDLLLT